MERYVASYTLSAYVLLRGHVHIHVATQRRIDAFALTHTPNSDNVDMAAPYLMNTSPPYDTLSSDYRRKQRRESLKPTHPPKTSIRRYAWQHEYGRVPLAIADSV